MYQVLRVFLYDKTNDYFNDQPKISPIILRRILHFNKGGGVGIIVVDRKQRLEVVKIEVEPSTLA